MEALRMALQRYAAAPPVTMGSSKEAKETHTINRQNLQRDLTRISKRNEKYFMVGVGMAIVLFIVLVIMSFLQQCGSVAAQAVPPLLGSSAAVIVWRMFHTWREKSYTDCVLAMVPSVDDEMLRTIVEVLVRKI